nr:uncharacterized protein LOC128695800 isoform X2 [Cherax quadricarinatus]
MPSKKKLKSYLKKLTTPPKAQARRESSESSSPGILAADCEWQGDGWRRPGRWSGQWDQGTPSTPTTPQSVPSTPPPMPAPPPEPQTNLVRNPSDNIRKDSLKKESPGPTHQPLHTSTLVSI